MDGEGEEEMNEVVKLLRFALSLGKRKSVPCLHITMPLLSRYVLNRGSAISTTCLKLG